MRLKILIILLLFGFALVNQGIAQELTEVSQGAVIEEPAEGMRVIISTSGAAKFSSDWLDGPPRLVVRFLSRNILSKIDDEVIVNKGVIKRITSDYSKRGRNRSLKSLTFELTQKVPYKIWQEGDTIILDIRTPFSAAGKEVYGTSTPSDIMIKRLEAMDTTLMGVTESPAAIETPGAKAEEDLGDINKSRTLTKVRDKAEEEAVSPKAEVIPPTGPTRKRKTMAGMVFSLAGLTLISGTGFLAWCRRRSHANEKLEKLKLELQEKDKRLEQEEILRKAIEKASLQKEKEYGQLRNSFESLKGPLMKMRKELSPAKKKITPLVPEKSQEGQERRILSRLPLTKDFSRTIIIRIESPNAPQAIRSFAKDISSRGLCFETKTGLKIKEPINLRLFFYGDRVPMMKIRARIIWKKAAGDINQYGAFFGLLEEKDRLELNRYIESKMAVYTN